MSKEEIAGLRSEIEELNILVVGICAEHQRTVVNLKGFKHTYAEAGHNARVSERVLTTLEDTRDHLRQRVREKTEEMQRIKKEMKEGGAGE